MLPICDYYYSPIILVRLSFRIRYSLFVASLYILSNLSVSFLLCVDFHMLVSLDGCCLWYVVVCCFKRVGGLVAWRGKSDWCCCTLFYCTVRRWLVHELVAPTLQKETLEKLVLFLATFQTQLAIYVLLYVASCAGSIFRPSACCEFMLIT